MDRLDKIQQAANKQNSRLTEIVAKVKAAGLPVKEFSEATLDEDASISINDQLHIQICLDGTMDITEILSDEKLMFHFLDTRSLPKIIAVLKAKLK